MGCDIHVFVEARFKSKWHPIKIGPGFYWTGKDIKEMAYKLTDTYGFFTLHDMDRNYTLFGILAGVRVHSITPMKPPTGYPADMSEEFEATLLDNPDLHTPTSYGVMELVDLWDREGYKSYMEYTADWGMDRSSENPVEDPPIIEVAREILQTFPGAEDDLRFIICFDN